MKVAKEVVGQLLRSRHYQTAAGEEVLDPNDQKRQKEGVTR